MNREIYKQVAKQYGTTVREVKKEMRVYLKYSHLFKPQGDKPLTPDEAILHGVKQYLLITAQLKKLEQEAPAENPLEPME